MAHILLLAHPKEQHAEMLLRALQRHLPEYAFTLSAARLVPFGGSVRASLQSALERTQAVLVLFNAKTTLEGWLDRSEIPDRLALELALRQNKPVQPILFPDGTLPAQSALPPELHPLTDRLVFRLNAQERFSELIQALRSLNSHHMPAVQPTLEPAPRDSTSDSQAPQPTQDDIRQFLANAGITIRSVGEPQAHDEPLDRIAQFMGTRYPHIKLVYQSLKRSLIDGETFSLNLAEPLSGTVQAALRGASALTHPPCLQELVCLWA
ncbi:MAG: hypothetical protein CUN51_00760 [Candidatus Thermofonsia Clade 1 bacterium]|uniref:TIR domain-containing protein n=1 Tax=Candidatus Thermofonsia Clade 1 bacterium TaxID=2364210 RepID=A0A2M8P3R9_9CHLR|nr:MAG: hypothetical protein CUN51_00760 [Candidatus Thermofonsia Clade 1 bacterium]